MMFVYKQKTAYEMRISDWSSDLCSSVLACVRWQTLLPEVRIKALGRFHRPPSRRVLRPANPSQRFHTGRQARTCRLPEADLASDTGCLRRVHTPLPCRSARSFPDGWRPRKRDCFIHRTLPIQNTVPRMIELRDGKGRLMTDRTRGGPSH